MFARYPIGLAPDHTLFLWQDHQVVRDRYLSLDCPVFEGLFDFCRLYTGASIGEPEALGYSAVDARTWGGKYVFPQMFRLCFKFFS
jgi:hypothetical protein